MQGAGSPASTRRGGNHGVYKIKTKIMKEKIIQIIGFGMEPERAELMADEIILNFNSHIITVAKETKHGDWGDLLNKLWIKI
jgi:hypothetical protein